MDIKQDQPIEIELKAQSSKLYIFFGGISAGILIPPFEFYNSSKIINHNKIFIRDFSQCWYHNGLPGISIDIDSTAKYIKEQIQQINPERVFFVGNSMGGYAAILFAALIEQGEVIAFAPQTFISPVLRLKYRDSRWKEQVRATYLRSLFKKKYWDLKVLLSDSPINFKISVFVSKNDCLDYIHAIHIKDVPSTQIYEFDGGGHEIVKLLRDKGDLPAIMSGQYS